MAAPCHSSPMKLPLIIFIPFLLFLLLYLQDKDEEGEEGELVVDEADDGVEEEEDG